MVAIDDRRQFADLLNSRGLNDAAAEIGTHRAEFASPFLQTWGGRLLYCVDPWQNRLPYYHDIVAHRNRDEDYTAAVQALQQFGERVKILRMLSEDAARQLGDINLDFVYIDANHDRDFVLQDIALWWPKVKPGGLLAGHDWENWEWGEDIQFAVRKFFEPLGLEICVTKEPVSSWFIFKPTTVNDKPEVA